MRENLLTIHARTCNLMGTSYEIGYQLGSLVEKNPLLKSKYILEGELLGASWIKEAKELFESWCPGLCEELEGFADALKVGSDRLYFYRMTYLSPRCSQVALMPEVTQEGKPLLARNYEYSHELEDFSFVKTNLQGRYAHMGTSMLESGRDDGLNEHGLAVTMTSCGLPVVDLPYMRKPEIKGLQYWVAVRAILENCKDVEEALAYLKEMPIAFNMNMILFDKLGHAALVQTMDGKKAVKQMEPGDKEQLLYTTNHAVLPDFKHLESEAFSHSIKRFDYIKEELEGKGNISRDKLKEMLLAKYPQGLCFHNYRESFGTTKSMIISPVDGTIELCWGGRPENLWRIYDMKESLTKEEFRIELNVEETAKGIFDWQSF